MDGQRQDATYIVAIDGDGLVLARRVSPPVVALTDIGQPLISYLGDDAPAKAEAASWALRVLISRDD